MHGDMSMNRPYVAIMSYRTISTAIWSCTAIWACTDHVIPHLGNGHVWWYGYVQTIWAWAGILACTTINGHWQLLWGHLLAAIWAYLCGIYCFGYSITLCSPFSLWTYCKPCIPKVDSEVSLRAVFRTVAVSCRSKRDKHPVANSGKGTIRGCGMKQKIKRLIVILRVAKHIMVATWSHVLY